MVKCNNGGCPNEYCCVECPAQEQACLCEIAAKLDNNKEQIIKKCEHAEVEN